MTTTGRPTRLNPELQQGIERALRAGVPIRWACEAAGLHHSTYYDWIARGEEWRDGDPNETPDTERPYVEFADTMRRARAQGLMEPAALLYDLIRDRSVDPAVRLRGLQFYLTHADRDHWHPKHTANTSEEEAAEVVVVWPE